MIHITTVYYFVFGILTIAGGIVGYVSKKSVPSIVAGSVCGLLLLVAAFLIPREGGFILGLVVSVALAGRFIPHYIEKKRFMPDALMSLLSAVSVTLTILAWYKK